MIFERWLLDFLFVSLADAIAVKILESSFLCFTLDKFVAWRDF